MIQIYPNKIDHVLGSEPWGPKSNIGYNVGKVQNIISLRTSNGNACINGMNHHFDTKIQISSNEDPRVCGVQTLWSKVLHRLQ